MTGEHSAPLEFRAAGRSLSGPVVNYGERATDRSEMFAAGAFTSRENPLEMDLQHDPALIAASTADGNLTVTDGPRALEVRATLKDASQGEPGSGPLEMVRRGVLRGLSAAFHAIEEHRADDTRVITKAHLVRIGLVDQAAYAGSQVELRAKMGSTVSASIPSGQKLACECSGPDCHFAEFMGEAMQEAFDEAFEGAVRDVTANWARYDQPLGSVSKGTVRRTGPTQVSVDLPNDDFGRQVIAATESTGIVVRPYLDAAESQGVIEGETMRYSKVSIRSFIISSTDARSGWPLPRITATPDDLLETRSSGLVVPRRRKVMAWR